DTFISSNFLRVPSCGGLPVCQRAVPAEPTSILSDSPASRTLCLKIASAIGERQIFPKQTNKTRIICIPPLYFFILYNAYTLGSIDVALLFRALFTSFLTR